MSSTDRSKEDLESVKSANEVFKKGNSNEDVINFYDKWAKDGQYMKDTEPVRYRAHIIACEDVEKFFPDDRDKVKVIDIGAGTGRAGEELVSKGFKLLDALEPSTAMLDDAKKLNIYQNFFNIGIGEDRLPIEDNTYDLGVVSGAMGEGHIPCEALHEMARIIRPGGLLTMSMREEFMETCTQYKGRLEPLMKKMEDDGEWKILSRDSRPNYYCGKPGLALKFVIC